MILKRTANAKWNGSGKEGKGVLGLQSGVMDNTQYSFNTRFAEGKGTNPEELIAAALAGCFSMKLAFNLQGAGFTADNIDTKATVLFEEGNIPEIQLTTEVKAPGLDQNQFEQLVKDAKENCPISKLLNTKITLQSKLA